LGSHEPKAGREEDVATPDKEEDNSHQEMLEAVAEKSEIVEDFNVDEDHPSEPLAGETIELLGGISDGQSASEPEVQIEIDVDNEPAAETVEEDGELTDQAVYEFASDDEENDF
jgi:hypothetical protein